MFQFFNSDQKSLQKLVREYVEQEIAPHAAEWDEKDVCPDHLWPVLGQMGFFGIFVPAQYGGPGLGLTERAIVLEEVSRHSAGLGIAMMTHDLAIAAILNFGTEEQKQKYLPQLISGEKIGGLSVTEPTGGSDWPPVYPPLRAGWFMNGSGEVATTPPPPVRPRLRLFTLQKVHRKLNQFWINIR